MYPHLPTEGSLLNGANVPLKSNVHHRLPRSRGGTGAKSNLSTVNPLQHVAWHVLVSNHWATTIALRLSNWVYDACPQYDVYPRFICKPNEGLVYTQRMTLRELEIEDRLRHTCSQYEKFTPARRDAWDCLFGGLTPEHIAEHINDVWLDPQYTLFVKYQKAPAT